MLKKVVKTNSWVQIHPKLNHFLLWGPTSWVIRWTDRV